jgi:hypothetical protein
MLTILANGVHSQGLTWSNESKISTGGSGTNIRPRILALDTEHGIIVWGNEHAQSIHYTLWENDVLSSVYNINMKNTKAFITSWASTEIAGRNQYVYIVYKEDPADVGKIYLLRSTDYGKTFSNQIIVVDNNGFKSRFPGVAIDKDNQPIVSYMRFKDDWSQPEYVSIRSSDFGNTFDPFTEATDRTKGEACDCCPVGMETDGDRIAVLYRNNRNNIRNMTAAVSLDNGKSYSITQELDTANWFLQSCPSTGGDGFFNDQFLYTTWNSGRTGITKVYYSRLNLITQKVDAFQMMNHNQGRNLQQTYPRMAGSKDTVGIAWAELVNNMDIFFSYFTGDNSGDLIKNATRINKDLNGNQASADVAFVNGSFYLCWQDLNDNSIKFKKGTLNAITKQNDIENTAELKIINISNGVQIISDQSMDEWQIYNLEGIEIAKGNHEQNIRIPLFNPGLYFLRYKLNRDTHFVRFMY